MKLEQHTWQNQVANFPVMFVSITEEPKKPQVSGTTSRPACDTEILLAGGPLSMLK